MGASLDLNVTVQVNGKDLSVNDLLTINDADLGSEYCTQAARFAMFSVLTAEARKFWQLSEKFRKEEEARAFAAFKEDKTLDPKGKGVTDGLAAQMVQIDEECMSARIQEIEARHKYDLMLAITNAFEQRASMLQSLGADLRAEWAQTGMAVRAREDVGQSARKVLGR